MFLKKLEIQGYKNFERDFLIQFRDGLSVLVGENGVGKSAIIDAIRLLLSEDEFGRTPITETDFHRPFQNPMTPAASFRLRAEFDSLSEAEAVCFLPWTDLKGRAALTLHVDNKPNYQNRYKRVLWGGSSSSAIFESDLLDTINCVYLPPLRDAEARLREGKASRLARLLRKLNSRSLKEVHAKNELHPLERRVQEFNQQLAADSSAPIAKANALIRDRLLEALGSVFGQDTRIQFAETNFSRIVESLRMLFFPSVKLAPTPDMFRTLEENSLGYNNLLYLATVLAELTEDVDEPEYLRILLIEEPEAHLHPQLQVRLLKYLEQVAHHRNVQIVVTTHSAVLASSVSLDSLIHLSRVGPLDPQAVPLSTCAIPKSSADFVERWLDATKSTLLFARGVLLVEGIAEAMLIPELAKTVLSEYNHSLKEGQEALPDTLEDAGVSVINMNGIYFRHFMPLFCDIHNSNGNKLPIRCAGLTDRDPPPDSKPTPLSPVQGNNPDLKLIEPVNASEFARLYSSPLKTFEYDLAMEGANLATMLPIADSLIATDGTVTKTFKSYQEVNWTSNTDPSQKATAAYFLLEHIEKGDYSQALAKRLSSTSTHLAIPQYMRQAIVWACGGPAQ